MALSKIIYEKMWLNKNIINFLKKSEDGLGGVREMYMGVDKKCKKKGWTETII